MYCALVIFNKRPPLFGVDCVDCAFFPQVIMAAEKELEIEREGAVEFTRDTNEEKFNKGVINKHDIFTKKKENQEEIEAKEMK